MDPHPDPASDPTPRETRNWMFVLDSGCPDCGFDLVELEPRAAAARLVRTLPAWTDVLARPDAADRPQATVWSAVEYACHVRDLGRLLPARLALITSFDGPELANWDRDDPAVEFDYLSSDPAATARELDGWLRAAALRSTPCPPRPGTAAGTAVVEHFFAAFVSGPDAMASMATLRDVLLPDAVIARTCGEAPVLLDVEGFIAPGAELLAAGGLVDFREWVTDLRIEVFGDIAAVWRDYAKEWTSDGVPGAGRSRKAIHPVRTSGGRRISAAA